MNQQHLNASEGSKRVANVLETWPYKYEVKTWNSWGKARAYSESYERSANYWKFAAGAKMLVLLYYALYVCFAPVERLLFAAETLALRYHKSHVRAPTLCACFKQAKKERRNSALCEPRRVYCTRNSSPGSCDSSPTRSKRLYCAYPGAFRILRSQWKRQSDHR